MSEDENVTRLREAIEKYGTPEYDNRVTLNLDDIGRIAYRAGLGPYVVTDAMVDAVGDEIWGSQWPGLRTAKWYPDQIRAALEAAERVRREETE